MKTRSLRPRVSGAASRRVFALIPRPDLGGRRWIRTKALARAARGVLAVLGVLSVLSTLAVPLLHAQSPEPTPSAPSARPVIVTTVTEDVEIVPDRASLTFAVETHAKTAAAAGADNARIQTAVLDALKRLGVAAAQLRTSGLSINPEYEYPREGGRPTLIGYQATNSVRVEVRQLAQVGTLIDAGLAKGATNVGALQFFASNTEAAEREALRNAVARARADADAIADAAGARVLALIQVTVLTGPDSRPMAELGGAMVMRASAAEAQTPIETGSLKVRVTIEAKFTFGPR